MCITDQNNNVIGSSSFYDYQPKKSRVEIGFTFISRKYCGGKWNGEIKRVMLVHAFESVADVYFHVGRDNHRSRRALEKIGASLMGEVELHDNLRLQYRISRPSHPS